MENVRLERNGRGYRFSESQLSVWSPSPALLLLRIVGHGHGDFAAPITAEFERVTNAGARVHVFIDLERMPNYDSSLRTRCTEHFRERLQAFESFHIHVPSRVVALGVAVANVALRGIVTVHATRAPFTRALDNQLAFQGVSDFSSDVLAS